MSRDIKSLLHWLQCLRMRRILTICVFKSFFHNFKLDTSSSGVNGHCDFFNTVRDILDERIEKRSENLS